MHPRRWLLLASIALVAVAVPLESSRSASAATVPIGSLPEVGEFSFPCDRAAITPNSMTVDGIDFKGDAFLYKLWQNPDDGPYCNGRTLGGTATRLYGTVGLRDDTPTDEVVTFRVYLDGELVHTIVLTFGTHHRLDLAVHGKGQVAVSTQGGRGTAFDMVVVKPNDYSDIGTIHPFYADVRWAAERGVTGGYPDGTFRGGEPVQRQAFAAFLYRMLGEPIEDFRNPGFSDVTTTSPFYESIAWMAQAGLSTGYPDGTFRPTAGVHRQAAVAFLARLSGVTLTACSTPPFTDIGVDHPFCPHIRWAKDNGITAGYADGTFRGGDLMSRQAAVRFLNGFGDS